MNFYIINNNEKETLKILKKRFCIKYTDITHWCLVQDRCPVYLSVDYMY